MNQPTNMVHRDSSRLNTCKYIPRY